MATDQLKTQKTLVQLEVSLQVARAAQAQGRMLQQEEVRAQEQQDQVVPAGGIHAY
ncbi:MAG: hypothetical protein ACPGQV_15695 [Alphaproteobacteria bacterium]